MNLNAKALKFIFLTLVLSQACSVQKSRNDISKTGLFYHNLTAKYNGYFNAKTLLDASELSLVESYKDDYSKILELYPYNGVADASSVSANLDLAIKKGSTVINLHRPSHWVPDTYLLIGQSQYLKQHYETAEETFKYMVNNYDKLHISTKKKTKDQQAKERAARVREQQEKRDEEKELKEKERKKTEKAREQKQKDRAKENKAKAKEREQLIKDRRKAAKAGKPLPKKTTSPTTKPQATDSTKNIAKKTTPTVKPKETPKEEDTQEKINKKGKPSKNHRPVLQDAQLWLAKTYIMRKNGIAAGIVLNQLKSDPDLYEALRPEIPVLQAYNHIRHEEYTDAIPYLKEALLTKGIATKQKARIAFVLGQLLVKQSDPAGAYDAYEQVASFNPSYELDFFAKLHKAHQGVLAGKGNKNELINDLKKLTKDNKNIEFGTAIYHSMALVALADNDKAQAKQYLAEGLTQQGDNIQKTESFYLLANLHYEDEEYLKAKNYFDSTLQVMAATDKRKDEVTRFGASLTDIAQNIAVIELHDSLLKVAEWTEKDQKQWAKKVIKEKEAQNSPKAGMLTAPQSESPFARADINTIASASSQKSTFFAYDEKALKKGIRDFEKTWGTIKLQDNWRLSQKIQNSFVSNQADNRVSESQEPEIDAGEEIAKLLGDLPTTPEKKTMSHDKIRTSMYNLGILYREKLENFPKSIYILEQVLTKYPNSDIEQDVLYQLYLASMQNKDLSRSDKYKNRLLKEFPGSKYTQAIINQGVQKESEDPLIRLQKYYDATFELYKNGQCEVVKQRIQALDSLFKENPIKVKFALLSAFCIGKSEGKEAYINSLKDLIARYPQSEERDKAKDMMRYLLGDEKAFETTDIIKSKEDPNAFDYVADELHYVIAIVYDKKETSINDLKVTISDFNQRYFSNDDLRISQQFFDTDATISVFLIRKFDDAARAYRFFETAKNNQKQFIAPEINHDVFAISQSNYRKLYSSKDITSYKSFFIANYQK